MPKIVLLDVDMTLVDNKTSQYNEGLFDFLTADSFDQVYLVTGRNPNDFWQHVLQMGAKPEGWRNQLLFNIADKLKQFGIPVVCVSTPYDHYLAIQPGGPISAQRNTFNMIKSGDAAEQFYMPFEKKIASYSDRFVTQASLVNIFAEMTGNSTYVAFPGGEPNEALIDALPTYLALTNDTEKRGQINFLLDRVCAENIGELDIVFFDDKPENLATADQLMAERSRVSSFRGVLVDKVKGYSVPEIGQPVRGCSR